MLQVQGEPTCSNLFSGGGEEYAALGGALAACRVLQYKVAQPMGQRPLPHAASLRAFRLHPHELVSFLLSCYSLMDIPPPLCRGRSLRAVWSSQERANRFCCK